MGALESIRSVLPESARDLKLNLQALFETSSLTPTQLWGVAVAVAATTRQPALIKAVTEEARTNLEPGALDDALAAAALMGMNNVFYRFRHNVGKPSYSTLPAGLRMNRMGKPLGSKLDFELFSLAVSAVNNCEVCVRSHEKVLVDGGVTEQQILDAVRLAAVLQGISVALT